MTPIYLLYLRYIPPYNTAPRTQLPIPICAGIQVRMLSPTAHPPRPTIRHCRPLDNTLALAMARYLSPALQVRSSPRIQEAGHIYTPMLRRRNICLRTQQQPHPVEPTHHKQHKTTRSLLREAPVPRTRLFPLIRLPLPCFLPVRPCPHRPPRRTSVRRLYPRPFPVCTLDNTIAHAMAQYRSPALQVRSFPRFQKARQTHTPMLRRRNICLRTQRQPHPVDPTPHNHHMTARSLPDEAPVPRMQHFPPIRLLLHRSRPVRPCHHYLPRRASVRRRRRRPSLVCKSRRFRRPRSGLHRSTRNSKKTHSRSSLRLRCLTTLFTRLYRYGCIVNMGVSRSGRYRYRYAVDDDMTRIVCTSILPNTSAIV